MRSIDRRALLGTGAGLAALGMAPAGAASLLQTPAQTEGPFYPLSLPLDQDNDLLRVEGRPAEAAGTVLHLGGRVLGLDGRPVPRIRVEIWQCDASGVYHHPGAGGAPDPNFQGFGHALADALGAYRFRTIVPVSYPGRTPHIHFKLLGPDFEALTTQMYVAGNAENERDRLYRRLGRASELVTIALERAPDQEPGAMSGRFDIVLGPDGIPFDG